MALRLSLIAVEKVNNVGEGNKIVHRTLNRRKI